MQLIKHTHWRVAATLILGGVLATSVLAGCSSGSSTAASGPKGCMKVGVLLPETDTSPRWEQKDHPLLDAAIKRLYLARRPTSIMRSTTKTRRPIRQKPR